MARAKTEYDAVIKTPLSSVRLGITTKDGLLLAIGFLSAQHSVRSPMSAIARDTVTQLEAYFDDAQWCFTLPLCKQGTPFQQQVWQQLCAIPTGETRSYGDVAGRIESAARAVGGACRRNPVPIVVPCHRVVAANGIGGFSGVTVGDKLDFKQWLLNHERV